MYVDAILSQLAVLLLALLLLIQLILAVLRRIAKRRETFPLLFDMGDRAFHSVVADAHGSSRG
jgi:hypothetical protein